MKKNDPNATFVNINYKCNNNCISCIREEHNKITPNPKLEDIKKIIDLILSYSDHIEFNGGEPTLRKDIFEVLNYTACKKKDIEIALLTNCRIFCNENYIYRLKCNVNQRFKIITSIYGSDAKTHDSITRTPGSFEQQINGIRNLLKNKIKIELRIIISKLNYKHLPDIADYLIQHFKTEDFLNISLINLKIHGIAEDNQKAIVYELRDIISHVQSAVRKLNNAGFNVKLFHFPHCILSKEFRSFSVGKSAEETEINFPEFCDECAKKDECSGIWKGYIKLQGTKEFKPINKSEVNPDSILKNMANLEIEQGIYGNILLSTAKDIFKKLKISKILIPEALLSFYPVVINEKGFCGTCLCIGGWGELENKIIKNFYIDYNLNIEKDDILIPFKNNSRFFSLYICILNALAQIDLNMIKDYLKEDKLMSISKEGDIISKIGFALHDSIDYSKAKEINIFDRGMFQSKERKPEVKSEYIKLKNIIGADFKTKVHFYRNIRDEIIQRTDVLLLSGSTLANGSIEKIIKEAKKARVIIVWGRSALIYPQALFKKGVSIINASIPPKNLIELAKNDYKRYIKSGEPGKEIYLMRVR